MNKKTAVYPGSFDPITNGHIDIIRRISALYDEVIVLVANSSEKNGLFSVEERCELIQKVLPDVSNLKVDSHSGLTVEYMKKAKASVIVRGLRAIVDFEYELTMANMNKKLSPDVETLLVFASPEYYYISSRAVKEVAVNGGALTGLVPTLVAQALSDKFNRKK